MGLMWLWLWKCSVMQPLSLACGTVEPGLGEALSTTLLSSGVPKSVPLRTCPLAFHSLPAHPPLQWDLLN